MTVGSGSGSGKIVSQLGRIDADGGQAIPVERQHKRDATDAGKVGSHTGGDAAELMEFDGEQQPSFDFKLGRSRLKRQQQVFRVGYRSSAHRHILMLSNIRR
jgi:hypothetical protein